MLTCQTNGRFLRFMRAKRRAINFHRPTWPEKPNLLRQDPRLIVAAIAGQVLGV